MQHAARPKETVTTKSKASLAETGKLDVSLPPPEHKIADAVASFIDVYKALEEYGPSWYSSKMRRKLQTSLRSLRYFIPNKDL